MEILQLQDLLQEKSDLIWMIEVREASIAKKIKLIDYKVVNKTTIRSNLISIMTKYYSYRDEELQQELLRLHCLIEKGIKKMKIEDLKDILP